MTEAKPCIVCGVVKANVTDDSVNQAEDGMYFRTHGQYGSRVFDPMDGSFLEITVCDDCMVRAREQGRVLWSRDAKPVIYHGSVVGWCKTPNRPLLDWSGDEESALFDPRPADDVLYVDDEDLANAKNLPEIKWTISPEDLLKHSAA